MRRARPLLGTIVSIEVSDTSAAAALAVETAFQHIATVHCAMSFHEPASDLRALARACAGEVVDVSAHTRAVLSLALQMEQDTGGAFNACCAAALVHRGLLPSPADAQPSAATSLQSGIALLADGRVRVLATPWIDLGGIAKGYAVDIAVQGLEAARLSGVVNAGGDLRVFGLRSLIVQVRDPVIPARTLPIAEINNLACATSAWLLAADAASAEHLIGLPAESGDNALASVTVFAPSCAIADALTKAVWVLHGAQPQALRQALQAHQAEAFVCHRDGTSSRI